MKLENVYLRDKRVYVDLNVDEIMMVEAFGRGTVLYTEKEGIETSLLFKGLKEKLERQGFKQSHRSCLINLNYIVDIHEDYVEM